MIHEPNLDMETVLHVVAGAYGLDIRRADFIPKGEVAWCYKLMDKHNRAFLLRITATAPGVSLASIKKLKELDFVLTPIDNLFLEHDGVWFSLYPFIDGETMRESPPDAKQMEVTGRSFARLHQTARTQGPFDRKETFAIPFEDTFQACIVFLTTDHTASTRHATKFKDTLSPFIAFIVGEYDLLREQQADLLESDLDFVNCHGDPSPQNLIFVGERMYLIDWDDLVYAPKEKDLLYFSDNPHFDSFMRGYREIVPQAELDGVLRAFYGRQWFLGELTEYYTELVCRPHTVEAYAHYLGQLDEVLEDVGLI